MNTHIRDNLKAIGDAWTSYTPAWTASTTNPVIGNGTITGKKIEAGKLTLFRVRILMGTTTTYGSGTYSIGLPSVPAAGASYELFNGYAIDTSAGARYALRPFAVGSVASTFLWCDSTTAGNPVRGVTATVPFTLASTDEIIVTGFYEAA